MDANDLTYFRTRELQERRAAQASSRPAAEAHTEMAERYAKLAAGIELSTNGKHATD